MDVKFRGFVGPAYQLESLNVDSQRCVNLYPEAIQNQHPKQQQRYYLKSRPGMDEVLDVGAGPIRCVHADGFGRTLIVSGNTVYKVTYSAGTWSSSSLGTMTTSTGIVKAATGPLTGGATIFVDGSGTYMYQGTGDNYGTLNSYGYTEPTLGGEFPTDITWSDGYYVVTVGGGFMASDLNAFEFDSLSYALTEGDPDKTNGIMVNQRDLWVFNDRSTEIYVNTGNPDFPFERVQGGFIEEGCLSPGSIAKSKGVIFWLGRDRTGQGIVNMSAGLRSQRISTHAIEQAISGYASPSTSRAYTYQHKGHIFYVLNFAEATWVYDLTTGLWHEMAYTTAGTVGRHLVETGDFFPDSGTMVLGHYNDGKVYIFNDSTKTDGGGTNYISKIRTSPYISNLGERFICDQLQIDMETGVGLATGQGSDPQVMLDWSDDGGHTYSDEAWTSAGGQVGGIGEYSTRLIWRRLGQFRQRIFRVTITDPVSVTFIDAFLKLRGGRN